MRATHTASHTRSAHEGHLRPTAPAIGSPSIPAIGGLSSASCCDIDAEAAERHRGVAERPELCQRGKQRRLHRVPHHRKHYQVNAYQNMINFRLFFVTFATIFHLSYGSIFNKSNKSRLSRAEQNKSLVGCTNGQIGNNNRSVEFAIACWTQIELALWEKRLDKRKNVLFTNSFCILR